jgi:hypothetical protein
MAYRSLAGRSRAGDRHILNPLARRTGARVVRSRDDDVPRLVLLATAAGFSGTAERLAQRHAA